MMKAPVGSRCAVTGSSSAMVSAGPMPGRMPMAVPSVTPRTHQPRLAKVRAVAKPSISAPILEHSAQDAGRQMQAERVHEADIGDDRQRDGDDDVAQIAPAAEAEGNAEEQDRRRRHEAEEFEQENLLDQADRDGDHRDPVRSIAAG